MSKHADSRDREERTGAAVATVAVVGLLGLVVALLAIFQPHDDPADAARNAAQDLALARPGAAGSAPAAGAQKVLQASTLRLEKVGKLGNGGSFGKLGDRLRSRTERVASVEPTTFRVATFNVLGASHTTAGGNKRGWLPASVRMGYAVSTLGTYDVDVVGLQEFESSQYQAFAARTGGAWGVYPGLSGDPRAVRNSIAWRNDTWELVQGSTFQIPYFHGSRVPTPLVLLKNIETGREVYFINVHNPATTGRWGNNERWRDAATSIEVSLITQLHTAGYPVVLTGDFNEREEVFCRITGSTTMRAANGGSVGSPCVPPGNLNVDWVFGSPEIEFTDFLATKAGVIPRATDHPLVVADASLPPDIS